MIRDPILETRSMADTTAELLELNQRLLNAIGAGDWSSYAGLCDPSLTAFEPEALGQLVAGLEFHKFYFDLGPGTGPRKDTMCSPHVRLMGDVAVLSYVRLVQKLSQQQPQMSAVEETRVWQRQSGKWKHVHFHRSPVGG